jgi:adenylate cyclase class 2
MGFQSYEVEVKVSIRSPAATEQALLRLGAVKTNIETQIDTYFNHPCRSFEDTDEALRLRDRKSIDLATIPDDLHAGMIEMTYKGPKLDTSTKTRYEMSVGISGTGSAQSILEHLGFTLIATVKKERTFFSVGDMVVSIDLVEHLGSYLEAERIVGAKDKIPEAREEIFQFLAQLGLHREDSIRESYLELYLEKLRS